MQEALSGHPTLSPSKRRIGRIGVSVFLFSLLLSVSWAFSPRIAHAAANTVYYVAPTGSDSNAGDIAHPFATIDHARQVVATQNQSMTSNITVFLRGGTYSQTSTLAFTPTDSGTNGYNIIYEAYPGETPVISGAQAPITGWTQVSGTSIWQADVGTTLQTRQLYVNGVRAQRASSPASTLGTNKNQGSQPIATPTTIESNYDLLTTPGQWYLDHTAGILYYIPRAGENMATATVIAPTIQTLVSGIGTVDDPQATGASQDSGEVIQDNYIHDVAVEYHGGVGIFGGFTANTTVTHNELAFLPYSGISWGWGWGLSNYPPTMLSYAPTTAANNTISYNYIHDVLNSTLVDGGPIYVNGDTAPTSLSTMEDNVTAGDFQNYGSLYLDNGSDRWMVQNNVVATTATNWLLVQSSSPVASNNTIQNNYYPQYASQSINTGSGNTYSQNTAVSGGAYPTAAQAIIASAGLESSSLPIKGTYMVNDTDINITYTGSGWGWYRGRNTYSPPVLDYQNDVYATRNNGDSFSFTFTGTGVSYISETDPSYGHVDISIDGVFQQTISAIGSVHNNPQQVLYSISGLPYGTHTITGVKDDGTWMLVDAFQIVS